MSREESKKIRRKRKHYEIENNEDEKILIDLKTEVKWITEIENLSKFQISKRILKYIRRLSENN